MVTQIRKASLTPKMVIDRMPITRNSLNLIINVKSIKMLLMGMDSRWLNTIKAWTNFNCPISSNCSSNLCLNWTGLLTNKTLLCNNSLSRFLMNSLATTLNTKIMISWTWCINQNWTFVIMSSIATSHTLFNNKV